MCGLIELTENKQLCISAPKKFDKFLARCTKKNNGCEVLTLQPYFFVLILLLFLILLRAVIFQNEKQNENDDSIVLLKKNPYIQVTTTFHYYV